MNKALIPLLGLMLGVLILSGPAGAADDDFRLAEGISIDHISGPGREQLQRALKKRTRKGPSAGFLSGHITLSSLSRAERETVAQERASGKPYPEYRPDPFTGRLWKYEVTPTATVLENFDLERFNGVMIFDWQLASAGGGLIKQGRLTVDLERTTGGYLAAQGVVPPVYGRGQSPKKFEARLADETVKLLTLDLGRYVSPSDLESAGDAWSRKAKSLAKKGDWNGARDQWLELLKLNPAYGPALYNLGVYWEREKNPEKALEYYRQAFTSDGSLFHRQTLSRLTETLIKAGRLPGR